MRGPSTTVGMTWQSVFLFDPDFHRGDIEMWFGSFELVSFGYCWSGRYTAIVTESLSSESPIPNPFVGSGRTFVLGRVRRTIPLSNSPRSAERG